MKTILPDLELEFELQELYILSKHWIQDISFIDDEIRFFKTVFYKFHDPALVKEPNSVASKFNQKIAWQEEDIINLKARIQDYLNFLEPFISDQRKLIDLGLIEKFNALAAEIKNLFESIKQTKSELFTSSEQFMASERTIQEC